MLNPDIAVESEDVDICHRWTRRHGGLDLERDFLRPGSDSDLRLDVARIFPHTTITDRIVPANPLNLIARIWAVSSIGACWQRLEGR